MSVKWWREGKQLAESGDSDLIPPPRIMMHANLSLQVSHIQPEDTGQYVCEVSRPAPWGRVTQAYAIRVKCKYKRSLRVHSSRHAVHAS